MRIFRLVLCIVGLWATVILVSAQDNSGPFAPPGAIPLGVIGFNSSVKVNFPFNARFYLKLDSETEEFISVRFEADDEMKIQPSVYMLNSDAEVLNPYSRTTESTTVTFLIGIYGKPPYFIVFNRPVAISITVFEGDRVRQRREDIGPNERVDGKYEETGHTVYHKLEGVQQNDIVTFYLDNDYESLQLFNSHGQFLNRALAYCHYASRAIQSYRVIGDPPYTIQLSSRSQSGVREPYTLVMKIGAYIHEPVNALAVNTSVNLAADDEGLCETITFKPPHSGVYVFSSEGNLDPQYYVQLTTDSDANPITAIDYRRDGRHVVVRYRFDTTDFVHITVSNSHSVTFSISDDTQATHNLFDVVHIKAGDAPIVSIQTDSTKTRRYEINGQKGDRVFVMTLYDYNDPYCFPVIVDRSNTPLYSYSYRVDISDPHAPTFWTEYILGESNSYILGSVRDSCRYIFQVFKAGTSVTAFDLDKSFAPLTPWRPPAFNS